MDFSCNFKSRLTTGYCDEAAPHGTVKTTFPFKIPGLAPKKYRQNCMAGHGEGLSTSSPGTKVVDNKSVLDKEITPQTIAIGHFYGCRNL